MKKYLILLCFILCISAGILKADNSNLQLTEMNYAASSNDMESIHHTTAHNWNAVAWFDHDAEVLRDNGGNFWIKISIIATPGYVICEIEDNPDYTGGIRGGYRTSCKYKAVGNGITYYFNCKIH